MNKFFRIVLSFFLAISLVTVAFGFSGCNNGMGGSSGNKIKDEALGVPKILSLGSTMCIACRMLDPELEELEKEYGEEIHVEKVNVIRNQDVARRYGVNMIPVQIFFDEDGNELDRVLGFMTKDDMVKKFNELGIDI